MKIVKRLFLALLILIILLAGSAVALPYLFKDKLTALAKEEINKNVQAKVDFNGVGLSLIRSFPNFSLALEDYSVTGINEFEGIPLATGKSIGFTLDLMSVISSTRPVEVKSVTLEEPNIHVVILKDGRANYDIALPAEETTTDTTAETDYSNVLIQLQEYSISNGSLIYDDRSLDVYADARNINHRGSGDLTIDVYDLDTYTEVGSLSVEQSGITYLKNAQATLSAIFNIEQSISKYNLKDNELAINDLEREVQELYLLDEDPAEALAVLIAPNQIAHVFARRAVTARIDARVDERLQFIRQRDVHRGHGRHRIGGWRSLPSALTTAGSEDVRSGEVGGGDEAERGCVRVGD